MRPVIGILGARADEIDPLFIKKNRSYENERYVKAVCNNGGSPASRMGVSLDSVLCSGGCTPP